jgi:glycosyltransferase involved in cell wall biosynthesis
MKIAWIFPVNKICGISFYSRSYVEALKPLIDIVCIDPDDFNLNKDKTIDLLKHCDLVHIQYETSFFLNGRKEFYSDLCASISCPIIVTLHEVYDQFPGVFPRDSIRGIPPLRIMKQWLYDSRHPYVTALTKHTKNSFSAKAILVHSGFQKDLLIKKSVKSEVVSVFPVPVSSKSKSPASPWSGNGTLQLASTGFVNDSFDYDLLMNALALCNLPWKFTWIGGVRRSDDQELFERLQKEIERRKWRDRFVITGILSKEQRDEILSRTHIYCAFFKYKSSSESLATAIGGRTMILATSLPLTREMFRRFPVMLLAPSEPLEMVGAIRRMANDKDLQVSLKKALTEYCNEYGRERMAGRLLSLYEKVFDR